MKPNKPDPRDGLQPLVIRDVGLWRSNVDAVLISAIIAGLTTVIAAWVGVSRQARRKSDVTLEFYRGFGEQLYQVRRHSATIQSLLSNDPGPNFAADIIAAGKAFRDACDSLQNMAGSNRIVMSKQAYDSVNDLISVSADLIESLNRGMSGKVPAGEVVRELNERGKLFKKQLVETEELVASEVRRL